MKQAFGLKAGGTYILAIAAARLQVPDASWREWAAYVLRAVGQQPGGVQPDFIASASGSVKSNKCHRLCTPSLCSWSTG